MTLALVLSENEYLEDFRDKEISSSLGKKIFQYIEFLKENQEKRKKVGSSEKKEPNLSIYVVEEIKNRSNRCDETIDIGLQSFL